MLNAFYILVCIIIKINTINHVIHFFIKKLILTQMKCVKLNVTYITTYEITYYNGGLTYYYGNFMSFYSR